MNISEAFKNFFPWIFLKKRKNEKDETALEFLLETMIKTMLKKGDVFYKSVSTGKGEVIIKFLGKKEIPPKLNKWLKGRDVDLKTKDKGSFSFYISEVYLSGNAAYLTLRTKDESGKEYVKEQKEKYFLPEIEEVIFFGEKGEVIFSFQNP